MWKPQAKTALMLARALEIIKSVAYEVSARWLFYRLLQESFYGSKDDYHNRFLPAISDARHEEYGGWTPFTLSDDTRSAIVRGDGYENPIDWLSAVSRAECELDHWLSQPNYVELWYEARAMTQQFAYYTEHMTLRPMGGDPSIRYKWDTAQALTEAHQRYGKPITILYFGDLDKKGLSIAKTLERDVRKWAKCDFQFIRAGLNLEQVRRYGVPENFEHPGSYQWEALSDDAAREIITAAVGNLVSHDAFSALAEKEREVTAWFNKAATTLANEWSNHHE